MVKELLTVKNNDRCSIEVTATWKGLTATIKQLLLLKVILTPNNWLALRELAFFVY